MPRGKQRGPVAQRNVSTKALPPELTTFFADQIQKLGRGVLFVDTGAIVGCVDRDDHSFPAFFDELVGERLITSTYVLVECVRRIVKAKVVSQFVGPKGERGVDLALHILQEWLKAHDVVVLTVPEAVFDAAKRSLEQHRGLNCDLTDMLSFEIIQGLEQQRIVAKDAHFKSLGLNVLPG